MRHPAKPLSLRFAVACILAAAGGSAAGPLSAAEEVWIGAGSWNENANWLDGSAPLFGADPALALRFSSVTASNNNIAALFPVNRLILDNDSGGNLSIGGSSVRMTGPDPVIEIAGVGNTNVSAALTFSPTQGTTTIAGTGPGNLTFTGALGQLLTIAGQSGSLHTQLITLQSTTVPGGSFTLQSGNLVLNSFTAVGPGPLVINGGNLRISSSAVNLGNAISLNDNLLLLGVNNSTISGVISSANNSSGLILRSGSTGTLSLTGVSTYNGATVIDYGPTSLTPYSTVGTLRLTGNASLLNSSRFDVRGGGILQIDSALVGATNRLNDSAPVTLSNGTLGFNTLSGSIPATERIGVLNVGGHSTLSLVATSLGNAQLTAAALVRQDRGTLLARGTNLGGTALAANTANALFSTSPFGSLDAGSGPSVRIVPWVIGATSATGTGAGFVTYDASTGLRPLNPVTEYASTLPAAAPTSNVRLTSALTHVAPDTVVNSLALAGGSLLGNGSVRVTSGAVLNTVGGALIENALQFANTEGIVFTVGDLTISGAISGSGGLTKSGTGALTLNSDNSFTGPLTVNAGFVYFNALGQLGLDSSPIALNGHDAGLRFTGSMATLGRDLVIPEAIGRLQASAGILNISGKISGAGGLRLSSESASSIQLTGSNTFSGPIFLTGGETAITSDASLGNGGDLNFNGGRLGLLGPWTTSRTIRVNTFALINTGGFDATWNGLVIGNAPFVKTGNGTLTLAAESPFSGTVIAAGGTLRLGGTSLMRSTAFTVSSGGRLLLDHSQIPSNHRVDDSALVTLANGELALAGNPGANVIKAFSSMTIDAGVTNTVTLSPAAGKGTTLQIGSLILNGGEVVIRGDALGAPAGGNFSRVVSGTVPASSGGLLTNVYVADSATGTANSFAIYESSSDSAGTVGIRPLRATEYSTGPILQNPANGGTTPLTGNVLAGAGTTLLGAVNTINSLTLENGGSVSLTPAQSLTISSGGLLVRAGAAASVIDGGKLEFGSATGTFVAFGDLSVSSVLSGTGGIKKSGSGTLTLSGAAAYSGATTVSSGVMRIGSGALLAGHVVTINAGAVFDLNGASATLGGLEGRGNVLLGANTLILGTRGLDMSFGGTFTGTGTINIVDGGNPLAVREFVGFGSFAGQVILTSGRLALTNIPFSSGTITLNGGSLYSASPGHASNSFILNTDLRIEGDSSLLIAAGSSITGAHDVIVQDRGGLILQSPAAHTGETRSTFGLANTPSFSSGAITLDGAAGALTATSAIRMSPGSGLILDDSTAFTGAAGGRIPDGVPVFLHSTSIQLTGNASTATTEKLGVLHGGGYNTVKIVPGSGASARLTAASLARDDRGTFLFLSPGLGLKPANGIGSITFDTGPAADLVGGGGSGPEVSILPYAIGETASNGFGSGLVTYDSTRGVRLLDTVTEYAATLAAATPKSNVRLAVNIGLHAPQTINSLVIATSFISGSHPLSITSGTVLKSTSGSASMSANFEFGNAEANIFVPGSSVSDSTTFSSLFLNGTISGTAGLTKSGLDNLVLAGVNTFTGPLTINAGNIQFTSMANLGADTSPIRINASATSAGLLYTGSSPLTFTRDIQILDGYGALRTMNSDLAVPGILSGNGGLGITGDAFVRLSGINTYTGPTVVQGGLAITSDAALGNGGALQLKNSSRGLRLDGPWTTSRRIVVSQSSRLALNGFDASLAGPLEGSSDLSVTGPGNLTLTTASTFSGNLSSTATLRLSGAGAVRGKSLYIEQESLILDNSAMAISDRIADGASVRKNGGSLQLLGNSTIAVRESISSLIFEGSLASSLILTAPGAVSTILDAASYSGNTGLPVTIQGDQLGGSIGGFTRLSFRTAPALSGRLLAGITVIAAATGAPESLALYDTATDAAGTIGVRALGPADYIATPLLANASNGGSTPVDANFLVVGNVTLQGATNTVNSLTLSGDGTLTIGAGRSLNVAFPSILAQSGANAVLSGGQLVVPGTAILVGNGNTTLRSTLVATALQKHGMGTLTLSANSFKGALRSVEGVTRLEASGAPASFSSVTVESAASLDLNGIPAAATYLSVDGTLALGGATLTTGGGILRGGITGTGGFGLRSTNTENSANFLTVYGKLSHSGPTVLERDPVRGANSGAALILTGDGSALATSGFILSGRSTLRLDNHLSFGFPGLSRIAATVPVTLNESNFVLQGSDSTVVQQNAGTLTGKGFSTVYIASAGAQSTQLSFAQLARSERGTFGFGGISGSAPGPGINNLFFGMGLEAALIGAGTTPILPYAVHNLNGSRDNPRPTLVTYTAAGGIRPLDITKEYVSNLSSSAAGQNVRLTTETVTDTPITINSLVLDGGSISGAGKITVTSGTVLNSGLFKIISNPLDFGSAEANLFCADGDLRLTGSLSGTGGITVTGTNSLPFFGEQAVTLAGNNSFTGPITVNAGRLRVQLPESFGPDSGEIVLNDAALEYGGASGIPMFTLNRPVRLNGTEGAVSSNTDQFIMGGVISGAAGLRIEGPVTLTGANTYSGPTNIAGTLSFASDAALGTGTALRFSGGTPSLKLLAPWVTDRTVHFASTGYVNTNGFDARIRGSVSGPTTNSTLEKTGAGTLWIEDASALASRINVTGGTLALTGTVPEGFAIYVHPEGTLTGDVNLPRQIHVFGTLAPGNGPGVMKAIDLVFNHNGTLAIELASPTAFDRLVTEGVTLNGTTNLTLTLGYDPQDRVDSFLILENTGPNSLIAGGSGRFAFGGSGLNEGTHFMAGTQEFIFSYAGGDGNDAVIYAVPEPGTPLLLLAAALPVLLPRLRKKNRVKEK
ncbi:MAG: autotransporter-associated beta strand repeat-containing protein, partial [Verrucomicrobiota bacterium]